MVKSKIIINKCEGGYRFEIIPCNNHVPLAISPVCKTHKECEKLMEEFCEIVLEYKLDSLKAPFTEILKEKTNLVPRYYYKFYNTDGKVLLYRKMGYFNRSECIKGIGRIYKIVSENR